MKPAKVKLIDWTEIVFDLERCGMTQREIGAHCGFADADGTLSSQAGGKTWVNRLKNIPGTQPKFHEGAMLLGLWAERMVRPAAEVPRCSLEFIRNDSGYVKGLPLRAVLHDPSAAEVSDS